MFTWIAETPTVMCSFSHRSTGNKHLWIYIQGLRALFSIFANTFTYEWTIASVEVRFSFSVVGIYHAAAHSSVEAVMTADIPSGVFKSMQVFSSWEAGSVRQSELPLSVMWHSGITSNQVNPTELKWTLPNANKRVKEWEICKSPTDAQQKLVGSKSADRQDTS